MCGAKVMEPSAKVDGTIHEGYAATSDYGHGEDYERVCAECFSASKDMMGWIDAS